MPDPQLASTSNLRWTRARAALAALVVTGTLAACGGDDEPDPAATATAPPVSTTAAPATGEAPDAELQVALTPEQAGTEERPQPVKIAVDLRMTPTADDVSATPVQSVVLTIPDGVVFRPDDLQTCPPEKLDAHGPSGCPSGARIGTGTVSARAGTIEVEGRATAVYGGENRMLLWVQIANPVSVGSAIVGTLEEQPKGGYRLTLEVPGDLQDVAGLPVALDRLQVSLGRGDALATTACPDGRLPFFAQLNLAGDVVVPAATTAACR